jgi:hypothetical protein
MNDLLYVREFTGSKYRMQGLKVQVNPESVNG